MIAKAAVAEAKGYVRSGRLRALILTVRILVCRDDDAGQGKLRNRQEGEPDVAGRK